jgi:hypothetical protein
VGERQQQRRTEDRHHDCDHHEVRDRDLENRPVQVGTRLIQVDGSDAGGRHESGVHLILLNALITG